MTLIEESSQYVDYQANQTEIESLLDEIAELREQNLQLTIDMSSVLEGVKDINTAVTAAQG